MKWIFLLLLTLVNSTLACAADCTAVAQKTIDAWKNSGHINVTKDRNGGISASLTTTKTVLHTSWNSKDCTPSIKLTDRTYKNPAFTDTDLARLINSKRNALIYVWSPRMPLSVDGMREIASASKQIGLPVTYLADPFASKTEVLRISPTSKFLQSDELDRRGARIHYPMLFILNSGEISHIQIPGHKTASTYRHLLESALEKKVK